MEDAAFVVVVVDAAVVRIAAVEVERTVRASSILVIIDFQLDIGDAMFAYEAC
jgi:hypothetical protein